MTTFKPVVVAAGIMHESNSFNSEPTAFEDFQFRPPETWHANNDEIAGFIDGAALNDLHLIPTIYASATPAGPVTAQAFDELTGRLIRAVRQVPHFDGILLALHGSMYTEAFPHADE